MSTEIIHATTWRTEMSFLLSIGVVISLASGTPSIAQEIVLSGDPVQAPLRIKNRCLETDVSWVGSMALSKENDKIALASVEFFLTPKPQEVDAWKTVL